MARPLVITDCDEVLLHFVPAFRTWLDEAHGLQLDLARADMNVALSHRADGRPVHPSGFAPLLKAFFSTEMPRQTPIAGAAEALASLSSWADIVVLTNLTDDHRDARAAQLQGLGFPYRVVTNQGPKGATAARLVADYAPSAALFVDDLARHIDSVADAAPEIWRLHMIGTTEVATLFPPARTAHRRIDTWAEALPWVNECLKKGAASPSTP